MDALKFIQLVSSAAELLLEQERKRKAGRCKFFGRLLILPPEGELLVLGDLHADYTSLKRVLAESRFEERDCLLLCLGDYADRGVQPVQVFEELLSLKQRHPDRVFLLRGNHEFLHLPVWPHELPLQLKQEFGRKGVEAYQALCKLFDCLPHAALVPGRYLLLHGGLPDASLREIAYAHTSVGKCLEEILWNDPSELEGTHPSPRGAGMLFGPDVSERVLKRFGVKVLIRSHQPCEGCSVAHGGRVLTLFSRKGAPYFNERAAYLCLDLSIASDAHELLKGAHYF